MSPINGDFHRYLGATSYPNQLWILFLTIFAQLMERQDLGDQHIMR